MKQSLSLIKRHYKERYQVINLDHFRRRERHASWNRGGERKGAVMSYAVIDAVRVPPRSPISIKRSEISARPKLAGFEFGFRVQWINDTFISGPTRRSGGGSGERRRAGGGHERRGDPHKPSCFCDACTEKQSKINGPIF